jgi:hypothetical protein
VSTDPVRLHPDPDVALAAWRFPAETPGPQRYHDVALMLGEAPQECPAALGGRHGELLGGSVRIVCWACRAVLRYWVCDCPDATFRDRACKHVMQAIDLYAAERRADRGGA